MINFKNRFHGHGSLNYLYRNGLIIRSKFITLKYLTNSYRKNSRISVIISKKITKKAVLRNRIRRRIYEIIRLELNNFTGVFDLAIVVNSLEINEMDYLEIKSMIKDILIDAEIIRN